MLALVLHCARAFGTSAALSFPGCNLWHKNLLFESIDWGAVELGVNFVSVLFIILSYVGDMLLWRTCFHAQQQLSLAPCKSLVEQSSWDSIQDAWNEPSGNGTLFSFRLAWLLLKCLHLYDDHDEDLTSMLLEAWWWICSVHCWPCHVIWQYRLKSTTLSQACLVQCFIVIA